MSELKAAGGDWEVVQQSIAEYRIHASAKGPAVATVRGLANAHLMAAAPELFNALESLMALESRGRIMPIGKEWDQARAALAKARGEQE